MADFLPLTFHKTTVTVVVVYMGHVYEGFMKNIYIYPTLYIFLYRSYTAWIIKAFFGICMISGPLKWIDIL